MHQRTRTTTSSIVVVQWASGTCIQTIVLLNQSVRARLTKFLMPGPLLPLAIIAAISGNSAGSATFLLRRLLGLGLYTA
jgi:hypothetical protein